MNTAYISKAENLYLGQISWRYYNKIKKKAMEQEFSWSGLLISLSIAFFIVIAGSYSLSLVHKSIKKTSTLRANNIYILENPAKDSYLHVEFLGKERIEKITYLTIA